jgi:ribonuclease P/MRP protein subunit POP5
MVRVKHRYLLVEFIFASALPFDTPAAKPAPALNEGLLIAILRESLSVNFGDIGWSKAGSTLNSAPLASPDWLH